MAYPTDPSEVGLTVAKSTLAVDTRTTIATSQTVEDKYFPQTVTVSRSGVSVAFKNCWFYGGGTNSVTVTSPATATFTNCEFGIFADDSTTEDPDGYDITDHIVTAQLGGSGTWAATDCYFHHGVDAIRMSNNSVVDHCFIHDLVGRDSDDHADAIQATDASGWTIKDSWVQCNNSGYGPAADLDFLTRALLVGETTPTRIRNFAVWGCYLDGDGHYIIQTTSVSSGLIRDNRFGRGATPLYPDSLDVVEHAGNRYVDNLALIHGETNPHYGGVTVQSPDRWPRYFNTSNTSGTTRFGELVTADATSHTKGSWVDLIASSSFDADIAILRVWDTRTGGADTHMLVDIGVDPSGGTSRTVVIPNYLCGFQGQNLGAVALFPVNIPAGSRVSARVQSLVSADTAYVGLELLGGPNPARDRLHRGVITDYGTNTATSGGVGMANATANNEGAWTLLGTASRRHSGLTIGAQAADNDINFLASNPFGILLDIGIDPAGGSSYSEILSDIPVGWDNGESFYFSAIPYGLLSRPIPSGATIAARARSVSSNSQANFEVAVYAF